MKQSRVLVAILPGLILLAALSATADETWFYTVQVSAMVQTNPPQIRLNWPPDFYGANNYRVYRKAKTDTSWGTSTLLPGSTTNFVDTAVTVGTAYEYRVIKAATLGYNGYGYIYSGIEAPLVDDRGTVILVVATNSTIGLDAELSRLQSDLTGDGWFVIRRDVSSNQTPASVRDIIIDDYNTNAGNVDAVFLFGHVPVLQSGNLNYDGHLARPMPADGYYGDMDGTWGRFTDQFPGAVELMVGRVDMFDMPGNGAAVPWPSEVELLRNYLNKDHDWRHGLTPVPRRALMGDRRGVEEGEATAVSGYRNFEPLVGPNNTDIANVADDAPIDERWISLIGKTNYLWAFGCGGGMPAGISHLGTNGDYNEAWSTDVVGDDARAVFVMYFGSWFGNWDGEDNFLRAVLATPTYGLACCMAGRPHWFLHHMGLGETIGYGTRLTMNNSTFYQNEKNKMLRAVYIALMGDPTLRMDPVIPPSTLTGVNNGARVKLSWFASPDNVAGYHVYRANSPAGPFTRLTSSLVRGTNFTDTTFPTNCSTYMVRAVKLQLTPSGTYYSASQGIFASVSFQVTANQTGDGVLLSWNSLSGQVYRVQSVLGVGQTNWADLGSVTASGLSTSWTDTNFAASTQRLYRVVSP